MTSVAGISKIIDEFKRQTPSSARLAEEAQGTFPSGVTHDARAFEPHSLYVERADGSRKWDIDGNEYVDYFGGHGALLLGHNHPDIRRTLEQHIAKGTHFGASHEHELRWGQLIQELVPSAECVRFTSSGTEATLLALRLARAWTEKSKIIRFITHFHGWHDHVAFGVGSHHDGSPTPGVLQEIADNIILCSPNDISAVREQLRTRNDIAAVILEPTGATWGQVPTPPPFLEELRAATHEHDSLLIFDEVVCGFRCSPGGAQAAFGITPDITTLAKILAGGLPGAAVVGRRDILDLLDHQAAARTGREKITHHGTFNANPLSAVAGVAVLENIARENPCEAAIEYAGQLRDALRKVVTDEGLNWCVYGTFSSFHLFVNPENDDLTAEQLQAGNYCYKRIKSAAATGIPRALRMAMLINGVDIMPWPGGPTSAVHTSADCDQTASALQSSIRMLKAADVL